MSDEAFTAATLNSTLPVVEDVRRAREVYRYLQPEHLVAQPLPPRSQIPTVTGATDTRLTHALAPFVQLAALRCKAQRALLNVTDRDTQYFLAEASRPACGSANDDSFEDDETLLWAGSAGVPKQGRICEQTLKLQSNSPSYPFFIVPDLSQDPRFAEMSVIKGPPYFRFYAGTPITTRNGINIGSLCVLDTSVRQGLTKDEEQALGSLSRHVMSYLEINREAIEGRRSQRMSKGLNQFIDGKSSLFKTDTSTSGRGDHRQERSSRHKRTESVDAGWASSDTSLDGREQEESPQTTKRQNQNNMESVSYDKILSRAANLLREIYELDEGGGVIFVGASKGFRYNRGSTMVRRPSVSIPSLNGDDSDLEDMSLASPMHQISTTTTFDPILNAFTKDPEHPAPLLALSTTETPFAPPEVLGSNKIAACGQVDKEVLSELIRRYPKGRLWLFDECGLVSASDEEERFTRQYGGSEALRRGNSSTWNRGEPTLLRKAFPGVRQLMFSPIWDAETSDWTSACFVWSRHETRVLTSATDLSFLISFGKTVMAELSRLDTVLADKQKGDFIGSISHELRSPLHGILASAEFLADTTTNAFQRTLISTVDSCGRTLLDTINHVLDFSKINSFERSWQNMKRTKPKSKQGKAASTAKLPVRSLPSGAPPLLRLYDITDVAAVTEEVIEGIAVGQIYSDATDITDITPANRGRGARKGLTRGSHTIGGRVDGADDARPIEVIIDIDRNDWVFMTQPGALRRVISNIFGNATKYTSKGTIKVRLQLEDLEASESDGKMLVMTISDTGKGISPAFLSSKLFVPFAQENSLSPGTGLGLSIVRSIVTMLGGSVDLRSRLGEGTTVQVSLPLQRPTTGSLPAHGTPRTANTRQSSNESVASSFYKDDSIKLLQDAAQGCKVAIYGLSSSLQQSGAQESSTALARYITNWYGIEVVELEGPTPADVVVVEERDAHLVVGRSLYTGSKGQPALIVLCSNATRHSEAQADMSQAQIKGIVEFVSKPCGPYKLATVLRSCLIRMNRLEDQDLLYEDLKEIDLVTPESADPSTTEHINGNVTISPSSRKAQVSARTPPTDTHIMVEKLGSFPFPEIGLSGDPNSTNYTPVSPLSTISEARTNNLSDLLPASPWGIPVTPAISPHVLLVDDNKINLSLLKAFMKKRKYGRVDSAEDGSIAVSKIKTVTEPYDIIFMDISMPIMNGFEATRAIRQHEGQSTPPGKSMIIALTGLASGRDQAEGFSSGCDIYMTKPVSFKEVGKLLDDWELHRHRISAGYSSPPGEEGRSRNTSVSSDRR